MWIQSLWPDGITIHSIVWMYTCVVPPSPTHGGDIRRDCFHIMYFDSFARVFHLTSDRFRFALIYSQRKTVCRVTLCRLILLRPSHLPRGQLYISWKPRKILDLCVSWVRPGDFTISRRYGECSHGLYMSSITRRATAGLTLGAVSGDKPFGEVFIAAGKGRDCTHTLYEDRESQDNRNSVLSLLTPLGSTPQLLFRSFL